MEIKNIVYCIEYIMTAYYQTPDKEIVKRSAVVWQDQMKDIPDNVVIKAVKSVVGKSTRIPYIADIKKEIIEIGISRNATEEEKKCYYIVSNQMDVYEQERKGITYGNERYEGSN